MCKWFAGLRVGVVGGVSEKLGMKNVTNLGFRHEQLCLGRKSLDGTWLLFTRENRECWCDAGLPSAIRYLAVRPEVPVLFFQLKG